MPEPYNQFKCEICRKIYRDFEAAADCEHNHYVMSVVCGTSYMEGMAFPDEVTVSFTNAKGQKSYAKYAYIANSFKKIESNDSV